MPDKKRIRLATTIYWLLLFYIVAALVWWFISLEKQNRQMTDFKIAELNAAIDRSHNPELYDNSISKINREHKRNFVKFVSEGSTFLLLTLIGAAFVYRSVRKQFLFQQQQQNFMMAVTHELKTPISVARLNLETLQKYQLDIEKQKKLLRMTLEETERLNTLTNNILISSQLEGGGYSTSKEELDLSDLFKDCIRNFIQRYPERKFIELIEPDMDVKGDPLLLQLLINNLLENAVKYSPREKPVSCLLNGQNGKVELHVIDEGPGIPTEEKKNIFKKFYRLGDEATRKTQGTGLGLYLCKKIAEDHNAEILVTNNEPQGSKFTVILPRSFEGE
ncbi:MAG TPA: ATP-binding protein [Chitinophagaceae bacterium]|jgi:signal transduction histidine kinase|nr:ATP-binding protein [Chitinophagaceae bacterium]